LRAGERALIPVIAVNREQAQVCHGYIKAMLGGTRLLASLIENETAEVISLRNGCDIAVMTNSFRTSRGRTMAACIFDECSFWRSEATNVPDVEVYRAIKPSMSTIPNSMLVSIGSAYRRAGLAFTTFREHFGKASNTLVVKATTKQLNPLIDQELIDAELRADPAGAASEWLSEFRSDIVTYIDREAVEAVVIPGRTELAPMQGVSYGAFCDPAGGSGQDSFTLCIAHWDLDSNRGVVDVIRERRPKFSPQAVIEEYSGLLRHYHLNEVTGDAFGGETIGEQFRAAGISYVRAEFPKSKYYADLLPILNSQQCELLDHDRLVMQLAGLERRVARGSGRENIDHPKFPGAHDDVSNCVAGALVGLMGGAQGAAEWIRVGKAFLNPSASLAWACQ